MSNNIVSIRGLRTFFFTESGVVRAVENLDLDIPQGKTLGLVGESGCGKSVTALSILRLIPDPPGKILQGSIQFGDKDLLQLTEREMRKIRGNQICMIFQDPMTSLNPVHRVGNQVAETMRIHLKLRGSDLRDRVTEMFDKVRIPEPEYRIDDYPHEFSGGMRQRVMCAMMLGCFPKLLIADEPTTNLDVTIQAQVLDLLRDLQKEFNTSIMLITHDLGVIADMADEVAIMYAGYIVEQADIDTIFENPMCPYTAGLLDSIPSLEGKSGDLKVIPGSVPNLIHPPSGCRFHPRCDRATERCKIEIPELRECTPGHLVACHEVECS